MEEAIQKLREMRLSGFIKALKYQMEEPKYSELSFEERLIQLIDTQYLERKNRRIEQNLKRSELFQKSSLEQIDFEPERGLKRSFVLELGLCNWINCCQNIIITGPTGVGKTFIGCALAHKACRLEKKAFYSKTSELKTKIKVAKAEGEYVKLLRKLVSSDVLVIDEWLREPLDMDLARDCLEIVDEKYNKSSCIIISQLPVKDWHENIQDSTIADAILDRILHNSHRISLKGESMRKLKAIEIHNEKNTTS